VTDHRTDLEDTATRVRDRLAAVHRAREAALPFSRDATRLSANAIRAIHRGDVAAARALLSESRARNDAAVAAARDVPEVRYAGFIHDALKEYAEAALTIALVLGERLPGPEELAVDDTAWLNGMGETVGELRRALLDRLRRGEIEPCERLLAVMDDLYSVLVTIDFPDAITAGLRRTTDVARGILEKTRGDFTVAVRQEQLERRMAALQAAFERGLGA
jgi:translin